MAKQFASEELSESELDRRIAAVRAAKRKAIEARGPQLLKGGGMTDEEIDRAIEVAERGEEPQVATATSNGKASPPRCDGCGRLKTPKGLGYWCKPCRDDEVLRAKGRGPAPSPTPVVNPRPPKPTYDEPTALERQMGPEPLRPVVVSQVVADVTVEPARPVVDGDFGEMLRETAAMRALVETLGPLRPSTRTRVVRWLADRFDGGAA